MEKTKVHIYIKVCIESLGSSERRCRLGSKHGGLKTVNRFQSTDGRNESRTALFSRRVGGDIDGKGIASWNAHTQRSGEMTRSRPFRYVYEPH